MNSCPTRSAKLMRASINEAALVEAGTDLGTPFGVLDALGVPDSVRGRNVRGAVGAVADADEPGECCGDEGGPAGAEQAEPSTITKLNAPINPTFRADHLWRAGEQLCCRAESTTHCSLQIIAVNHGMPSASGTRARSKRSRPSPAC